MHAYEYNDVTPMKTSVSVKITCSLQCSKVPAQGTRRRTKTHEGNRRHLRESILHLVVHGLPQITHGLTKDQVTTVTAASLAALRGLQVVCGHAVEFSLPRLD